MNNLTQDIRSYMGDKSYNIYPLDTDLYEFDTLNKNGTKISFQLDSSFTMDQFKKKYLDMYEMVEFECKICRDYMSMGFTCDTCGFIACTLCYMCIIQTNKGISKCAHCRTETGRELSDESLIIYLNNLDQMISKNFERICKANGIEPNDCP